jgi:hypothetical protein
MASGLKSPRGDLLTSCQKISWNRILYFAIILEALFGQTTDHTISPKTIYTKK